MFDNDSLKKYQNLTQRTGLHIMNGIIPDKHK